MNYAEDSRIDEFCRELALALLQDPSRNAVFFEKPT